MAIESFSGPYRFLSNFWLCKVEYDGLSFPSSENAYQWAKLRSSPYHIWKPMLTCTPAESKRLAGRFKSEWSRDWDEIKYEIMEEILHSKFNQNIELGIQLIRTGNEELIEGNTWGDMDWGVCKGIGHNHLGRLLMKTRNELRRPENV